MKIKLVLTFFIGIVFSHAAAYAQCAPGTATAGSTFFNDATVGTFAWVNPQDAQVSDGVYSIASVTVGILATVNSNYLTATGFGFAIPTGATICGVTVTVQRRRVDLLLGDITDNSVKLTSGGSISGTEHASATSWSTTEETVTYGGSADTWGLSLTPAIVNDASFGVGVSARMTGGPLIALLLEGGIDYISMTITYNTSTMAITLQDFSAVKQNNTDVLNWTASSTDAGDKFVVQRSGDSKTWQDLATMPVHMDNLQYSYTDETPLNGSNYYRLYLENMDARGTYSTIKEVSQEVSGITCFPNPVGSTINISSPQPIQHVVLKDLQGRTIDSRTINTGSNTLQLPAGTLPAGVYLLQVDGAVFKMVKQ